jgi:anti-sigma regulatory factor (Ser/Thr protein kinase)
MKYLDLVYSISKQMCSDMNFSERSAHFVLVAVSEGFTNAVVHGNCGETERTVAVIFERTQEILSIAIEDEGVVPIQENMRCCKQMPHVDEESGRGLGLISQFAEEFTFVNEPSRGNILTMKFHVENKDRVTAEANLEV